MTRHCAAPNPCPRTVRVNTGGRVYRETVCPCGTAVANEIQEEA